MTTELHIVYVKSSASSGPHIRMSLAVSALSYLKLFFLALFARKAIVVHTLSVGEIDQLSSVLVRWRLVNKLREVKK